MKNKTAIILVVFIVVNVLVLVVGLHWRAQKQQQYEKLHRDATRYAGATGTSITAFDERTNRWIAEMKEETIEVTLEKLTDAMEYDAPTHLGSEWGVFFHSEEARESRYYSRDIEVILSNRRFRKAYEDLQKANRRQAAELLTKNIKENLAGLRTELQYDMDMVSQGKHTENIGRVISIPDVDSYRLSSNPDHPPTRTGRRYAVFSYVLLASLLELQEVRPAIEEVIEFAKKEYALFNNVGDEAYSFKVFLLRESLYNPSLLLTATLCDPNWNDDKHKLLETKLVTREVVDYQARAIEHDKDAREGWIPIVPYDGMLKIRYYKDITDAEFNAFFGK